MSRASNALPTSLMKDLRGITLLKQALDDEPQGHTFKHPLFNQVRQLRLHRIAAEAASFTFATRSKLDPEWGFLLDLHDQGQRAADAWLARHWGDLGQRSTLNLESLT
jgi:NTE family protein